MTTKVTGSILANTAVTAGRYGGATTVGTFTVDAQGRLIDSGNTTIAITSTNLDATGVTGTTYGGGVSSANFQLPIITVDTKGRITAASNVSVTSTSIYANTGQLVANASTGVVEIGLADTAVTPGRYGGASTVATHTVDAKGRLIDSSNVTIAITSSNLDATGVTGTTYGGGVSSSNFQLPVVTVDTKGRITAASNVTVTSTAIYANTGQLVANSATGVVQIGLATSGANPGNYGSGTTTPVIQVDALGRITSVSSVLITGGSAGTGSTTYNRTTATATAGQTLFSSIPHTVGYLQVYINGVLLTPNDYTANASNSAVVLTTAASVGDQFEAFAYTTTLANNLSPGTTGGSAGVILYQSAANTTGNTIVGTSGQVLTSAGTGQPTWTTLSTVATSGSASDLGSGTLPSGRLPTSGVTAGAYGNTTTAVAISIDSTGRVTAASNVAISGGFSNMVVLTSSNASYSIPATKIKVTVVGGGGNAGGVTASAQAAAGGGGGGGTAIKILSGLTIGNTLNITVGAAAGTSSVASGTQTISTVSATGGTSTSTTSNSIASGGVGGVGSGGDLNISGSGGGWGTTNSGCPSSNFGAGNGGSSMFGGGVITPVGYSVGATTKQNGTAGAAYGGGGSGGWNWNGTPGSTGGAGAAGVVIVEY